MGRERRIIGVDESGKGDFFGPLVVAAFLASDADVERLLALGVRDGKLISENKLLKIDDDLRSQFPHAVEVVSPEEYNRQYAAIKNLNKLLANGHAAAIQTVAGQHAADMAVSDKFGKPELVEEALAALGQDIPLSQLVRGERIPQVAAASILARAEFIRQMRQLSEQYRVPIPRGAASQVDLAGRGIVDRYGIEFLPRICKTHFKNYQRVVSPGLSLK